MVGEGMKPYHIPVYQSWNLLPYMEQFVHRACCLLRINQFMEPEAAQSTKAF